jgi:hypothetical protein
MAKGIWQKNSELNRLILNILNEKNRHMTTSKIRTELLNKYNVKRSWQTVQSYLLRLLVANHIAHTTIENKNTIHIWLKLKS